MSNIKKAFDKFSDKEYEDSKAILSKEIDNKINDYFKSELGLEKDPIELEKDEE